MVHLENTSFTNRTVVSTVRLDTLTLLTIPSNMKIRLVVSTVRLDTLTLLTIPDNKKIR